MSPVPFKEELVRCYVIREKGNILNLFPRYYLYTEGKKDDEDGDVFLMAAKKRKKNRTANYCICTDKDELYKSDIYTLRRIAGRDRGVSWGDK